MKIVSVGDILIREVRDRLVSSDIEEYIKSADIAICNFEGPINPAGVSPLPKAGPTLMQHTSAPKIVKECGFHVACLANNHIYDYGMPALEETLRALEGLTTIGAGWDYTSAYALKVIEANGLRVGFLAYGEAQFGAILSEGEHSGGFAWINHPRVGDQITSMKKKVDLLIIQVHAGVEGIEVPIPEWRDRYRQLIQMGADAVIGHHPHVRQGWELYQGKPIIYSLGNFIFDPISVVDLHLNGYLLELGYDGSALASIQFYPVIQKNGIAVIDRGDGAESDIERLSELLVSDEEYENLVNRLALELWQTRYKEYYKQACGGIYIRKFLRSLTRIARNLVSEQARIRNDLLLLHNIRIESHRWCVERALSILIKEKYHE